MKKIARAAISIWWVLSFFSLSILDDGLAAVLAVLNFALSTLMALHLYDTKQSNIA